MDELEDDEEENNGAVINEIEENEKMIFKEDNN